MLFGDSEFDSGLDYTGKARDVFRLFSCLLDLVTLLIP